MHSGPVSKIVSIFGCSFSLMHQSLVFYFCRAHKTPHVTRITILLSFFASFDTFFSGVFCVTKNTECNSYLLLCRFNAPFFSFLHITYFNISFVQIAREKTTSQFSGIRLQLHRIKTTRIRTQ